MIVHIRFLAKLWIPLWLLLIWKQTVMMSLAQTVQVETSPFAKTDGTAPTVDITTKMLTTKAPVMMSLPPAVQVETSPFAKTDGTTPTVDITTKMLSTETPVMMSLPPAVQVETSPFAKTNGTAPTVDITTKMPSTETPEPVKSPPRSPATESPTPNSVTNPAQSTTTESSTISSTSTLENVTSSTRGPKIEPSTISPISSTGIVTSSAQNITTESSTISPTSTTESVTSSAQTPPVFTTTSQAPTESSTPTVPSSPSATPVQQDFCLFGGSTYEVGATLPELKHCQDCKCTDDTDPVTGTKIILCEPVVCQEETCQSGFTYERSDKECCGTCKQISCVLNGTEEIVRIMPGESWYPPGDKCTYYECEENNFTLTKKIISCPKQKIRKCKKGALIEVESADKCCKRKVCTTGTRECKVKIQKKMIRLGDCSAIVPVPYCKGSCNKSSRSSSSSSEEIKYKCSRCEAKKSQVRKIKLACENGRRESYTYNHVEECQCKACTPSN